MNKSLFRSPFALVALLATLAWISLLASGRGTAGVVGATGPTARWATGALALLCLLLALGYVLRKYMHKYGYSPEFKFKVEIAKLERAETRLGELRREILQGRHASRRAVEALAARVLREEGVHRVLQVEVREGAAGGPRFTLLAGKAFPFGKAAKWLHLHLYISVAFAFAVFAHGGDGWDSPLGALLLVASAVVVVTGIVGIFLWAFGPAWLTRRERDLSIEESFVLRESFRKKLAELADKLEPDLRAALQAGGGGAGGGERARALQGALSASDTTRRVQLQDALVLQGQLARVEAEFGVLWRTRLAFMGWRAVHLPAALLLAAFVAAHLLSLVLY